MKTTLKFKLIFSALFCFAFTSLMSAQPTAEEWLNEAATAEAEGHTQDAASAYSGAAHEQMKDGDYEAAGENFKKAAEGYRKVGKEAQANAEAKNAGNAYEKAADEASNDGDHERAAELYEKAAEQYDAAGLADDAFKMRGNAKYERQLAEYASAGNPEVSVKPTGTGRTIGNIANISVTNNNPFPVSTVAQDVYIPANEGTQDYVGRIPEGIVIPPNETVSVPVDGICVDPTTPPVGPGEPMADISTWVHVGGSGDTPPSIGEPQIPDEMNPASGVEPQIPDEMNPASVPMPHTGTIPVVLVTNPPVPEFDPTDIPDIVTSKGFNPSPGPGDIVVTWPGTDIPVPGVFNPKIDPETYARIIVDVVARIEIAAREVQESGEYQTPFTPDPFREYDALRQHTTWAVAATLTGGTYDKDDFARNVHNQIQTASGVPVTDLPREQQEEMEAGVSEFWNAYMATGVTAKVLPEDALPDTEEDGDVLIAYRKNTCECGEISVPVTIQVQKKDRQGKWENDGNPIDVTLTKDETMPRAFSDAGNQLILTIGNVVTPCKCITPEHSQARDAVDALNDPKSNFAKARADTLAMLKAVEAELADFEKLVSQLEDDNKVAVTEAEKKLEDVFRKYREKTTEIFDKTNKKGTRQAQLQSVREKLQTKKAELEAAKNRNDKPLNDAEAKLKVFERNASNCHVIQARGSRTSGPKIIVMTGPNSVTKGKDGTYVFSTNSVSFSVSVKYFCSTDDCAGVTCEKTFKFTFTKMN